MTGTGGPELSVDPLAQCSAGATATIQVQVWHHGPRPAEITVAVRGLDAEWTPEPVSVGILPPGQVATVPLSLRPGPSAIGARYPFVVVAAATDSFDRGEPAVATFESTLVVGGRERAVLDLDPPQATAVFGRRIRLTITNPSVTDRDLLLEPTVPQGLSVTLPTEPISVGAGRTVTVRGRVSVRRSRVFGTVQTHSYAIASRGQGAPVIVNGTLQARPVFRGALVRALVLTLVIALWVGLAVVALPGCPPTSPPTRRPRPAPPRRPPAATAGRARRVATRAAPPVAPTRVEAGETRAAAVRPEIRARGIRARTAGVRPGAIRAAAPATDPTVIRAAVRQVVRTVVRVRMVVRVRAALGVTGSRRRRRPAHRPR